jgi:hypothetical protein
MTILTTRIQKAIDDLKEKDVELKADYKRAHRGLKYKWSENAETYKILGEQERLIYRCAELKTTLKVIAEFEGTTLGGV